MRIVRIMAIRTFGAWTRQPSVAWSVAFFLAFAGALTVHGLFAAEGARATVSETWARAAAWTVPLLSALLSMHAWAGSLDDGRRDLLLCAPVTERALFLGRFLGVYAHACGALLLSAAVPVFVLPWFAPALAPQLSVLSFAPAFGGLALEAFFAVAVGCLASVCVRSAAVSAVASLVFTLMLPYGLFRAALQWNPVLRGRLAELPCVAHAVDFADAYASVAAVAFYIAFGLFALFAGSKVLAGSRFAGVRGLGALKASTSLTVFSAFVFTCLLCACAMRFDRTFDMSFGVRRAGFSARTLQILADGRGETPVTCFLSRASRDFRPVARLLRQLAAESEALGGAAIAVEFVDPRWDVGKAAHLVRDGVPEGSLVFGRGRRTVVLGVTEADESACASALQRLSLPARREVVYWTTGHGESAPADHDAAFGLSDLARALRQGGYRSETLPPDAALPEDGAAIAVAGARTAFSAAETARFDAYLKKGGRLLVLTDGRSRAGADALLGRWGVSFAPRDVALSGLDGGGNSPASDFGAHPVTRPLAGTRLVFAAGASAVNAAGAVPLVKDAAGAALSVAIERGGELSGDLALRPTRVVVVGDASFALNGALASRANANLAFLLNAFSWLAGLDASTAPDTGSDVLLSGLSRDGWLSLGVAATAAWPALFALFAFLFVVRGRRS